MAILPHDVWWIALVTFERGNGAQDVLLEHQQGACGWMACFAASEDDARDRLSAALNADGLRLVEVDRERRVDESEDLALIDEHLASNFTAREDGAQTVWGAVHAYLAEGEC
jgi:hypothetical protein